MNLRAIVVDDEPLAVRRLQIALERIGGIELLGTAADGVAALELISAFAPDLVLLDIKMPVMDGFDLVKALASAPVPEIIFVTAYSDYAIRAFEAGAVGYVLKPIDEDRLRSAVERARVKLRTGHAEERLAALSALLDKLQRREPPSETPFEQELWISSGTTIEKVAVGEVDWFEAAGDYVAVHCGQREHLLHDSLRSLVLRLNPDEFARVHRKAIVRLDVIEAVERGNLGALILRLASGQRVSVSRTYKLSLLARIRARRADRI
ncbi:MAG: two-component system, LytTR family, response regulator [Sphingomonadales bacterium]|jgi:DNA-binding LytR/AlgR family response regulator|nr:two-component system, LytTR family, response regulator [Sphingomonadales bacterium]